MMTVGKLIEILQKAPKDMNVLMLNAFEDGGFRSDVGCVGCKEFGDGDDVNFGYQTTKLLLIGDELSEESFAEEDLLWGKHLEDSQKERLKRLTMTLMPENEKGGAE